jgi:26S proteasome regulatory subunit N8
MYNMFKKINAREKVVGWYTTGTRFKSHDIEINEVFKKYCANPVFVIIDVEHTDPNSLPNEAYISVEEVKKDGSIIRNFAHIPSTVRAFEPEEIGVEQLLRELKEVSMTTLTADVNQKVSSLRALINKLDIIRKYLAKVAKGELPINQQVIYNLQEIMNLLPNLNSETMTDALTVKSNDMTFTIYVCAMIRAVTALHDLINNKLTNKEPEKPTESEKKPEKAADSKEKEGKDKEGKENKADAAKDKEKK